MGSLSKLAWLAQLPDRRDWFISFVERLIVLAIATFVLYFAWVIFGSSYAARQAQLMETLRTLNDSWKAVLLLLIPLFYRTIRLFLEQTEEAFGMKRKKTLPEEAGKEPNPQKP